MDISTLIPNERVIEIKHPVTDEKVGIRVTLVSLDDEKTKQTRRRVINKRIEFEKKGKNFRADDIEENEMDLIISSMTGWEWYDADFNGEKPVFNEANVKKVLDNLPWFKRQIAEAISDEKAFFQG